MIRTCYTSCLILLVAIFSSCTRKEDLRVSSSRPEKDINLFFGANNTINAPRVIHLFRDTVYILTNTLTRNNGEELIIEEGTLIKVNATQTPQIIIRPGAMITANGTAADPIVFTSSALPGDQQRNWGGILIQGRSSDNSIGEMGNADDASGSIQYVRLEFGGLHLNAAGRGTIVNNIQVSYCNNNPSFRFEGGTFNGMNLLSYASGGSADFYIAGGYSGKLQNLLGYRHPYFGNSSVFPFRALCGIFIENNNNNPVATPLTRPVISNMTLIGPNGQDGSPSDYKDTSIRHGAIVTTGNATFRIRNSIFLGFPAAGWYLDDLATGQALLNDRAEITSSIFQCPDPLRVFYLKPTTFPPLSNIDFREFVLRPSFANQLFNDPTDFGLTRLFDYREPSLIPLSGSPVLSGAEFSGNDFSDPFFQQVTHKGAVGPSSWLSGWVNFNPLETDYNQPH